MKTFAKVSMCAAALTVLSGLAAAAGCSSKTSTSGTGADSGGGGSGSGSSSGSASSSSGSSGSDSGGNCTIGVVFGNLTCPECATCLSRTPCCDLINNCLADQSCLFTLTCQSNCFNGVSPDGGMFDASGANADPCVAECPGGDAGVFTAQDNCQNTGLPNSLCNTGATSACMCPGDGG
jgi:hypothetical protein